MLINLVLFILSVWALVGCGALMTLAIVMSNTEAFVAALVLGAAAFFGLLVSTQEF